MPIINTLVETELSFEKKRAGGLFLFLEDAELEIISLRRSATLEAKPKRLELSERPTIELTHFSIRRVEVHRTHRRVRAAADAKTAHVCPLGVLLDRTPVVAHVFNIRRPADAAALHLAAKRDPHAVVCVANLHEAVLPHLLTLVRTAHVVDGLRGHSSAGNGAGLSLWPGGEEGLGRLREHQSGRGGLEQHQAWGGRPEKTSRKE